VPPAGGGVVLYPTAQLEMLSFSGIKKAKGFAFHACTLAFFVITILRRIPNSAL